jgi:hypothetical protein
MPTLTASNTFTVGDASVEVVEERVSVVAAGGNGTGRGRLWHPTFGAYDYPHAPDEWTNVDGDALIAPVWQHEKTLDGGQNTLWPGKLRDVECVERWIGDAAITADHLRMLLTFWMNPPDPAQGYVLWHPTYINVAGYKVVLRDLRVSGDQIGLSHLHKQGLIAGPVELVIGVVDYED